MFKEARRREKRDRKWMKIIFQFQRLFIPNY